jgi:hypothetical protein
MTNEEKIKALELIKENLCAGNTVWDAYMMAETMDAAIEALKFRGAYEIAVKAANKAFENRWTQWVEWIPCSERLPNEEEKVLVTDDDGTIYIAYYTTICDEPYWTWAGWSLHPKAWMLLPTPYSDTTPSEEGGNK